VKILITILLAVVLQEPQASVEGIVVRSGTSRPVGSARILLARTDGPITASIVGRTDKIGRFTLSSVPPGRYRLFVEHADYVRTEFATPVIVAAGQRVQNISISLTPLGVITGHVLNELGDPASKIYVRAAASGGSTITAETRTNDLGEYRLFGLPPGAYLVSAERYAGPRIEQSPPNGFGRGAPIYVTPTPPCPDCPGEGRSMVSLATVVGAGNFIDPFALSGQTAPVLFFPGTTDRAAAQPVEVEPGNERSGINFQLIVR
jgi:hypothetical protein